MGGVFGVYDWSGEPTQDVGAMVAAISHHGSDAEGIFCEPGMSMGNQRPSIIDLNEATNQPLYSQDKDTIIVLNGEIYNYIELRHDLRKLGYKFHTQGEREVLLHAFTQWGPEFVHRLNGMFAIAIYQKSDRKLWLFRDRLGIKPLYISGSPEEGKLWFASEIKAILANGRTYKANLDALAQFMALDYVPPPQTMFENIHHLPAGHWACMCPQSGIQIHKYWNLSEIKPDENIDFASAQAGFIALLDDATRIRLRSDAPFGALLSGGLNSTSVVAMMSLYQNNPVRTYSVGFDDEQYDDTKWAKLAAHRFGALHHAVSMDTKIAEDWPRFIWHCDQPHGDVSFIPSYHVSEIAAKDVKMVLTGNGGDEIWGGSSKHLQVFTDSSGVNIPSEWINQFVQNASLLDTELAKTLLAGELKTQFLESSPARALTYILEETMDQDPINRVLAAEIKNLLPGKTLVNSDRMAMAHGLELRSPYLDHRMVEFAFKVPGKYKLKDGVSSAIPKAALQPLLGTELAYRKKQISTQLMDEWLLKDLASFAKDTLLDGRLEGRKLFDHSAVEDLLETQIDGRENHTRLVQSLISIEMWYRQFVD